MSKFEKATKKVARLRTFIKRFNIRTKRIKGHKYLVFYKKVNRNFSSWWISNHATYLVNDRGAYRPGTIVMCREWNTDPFQNCGTGLHIGTLSFAERFSFKEDPIIEVLIRPQDIICVPVSYAAGKIRCKRLRVARIIKTENGRSTND